MAERKVDTVVRYSPMDIPKIIRAHWNAEPKEPVHFVGEPSTVKSASVLQESKKIAADLGREFLEWNRVNLAKKQEVLANPEPFFIYADLRASETDIGELRLQDLKDGKDYITFKYNILFGAMGGEKAMGVLFFDEMNLAPNMVKAQFYKIINDRAVGDIPISDGVLCVSAGNEAEHSRGVTEDPVPLVLRRGNYFVRPPTQEEFNDYAVKSGHHHWVLGYLAFQPGDVHKIEYEMPDSVGQPCVRTWSKVSNLLNHGLEKKPVADVVMMATGLVGQGVATKFGAYVKSAKEIDLNAIIAKPELVKEYEKDDELSLIYAIISGVVDKFRTKREVIKPAFQMSLHFKKPEFGAFLLRSMKAIDQKAFTKAAGTEKLLDQAVVEQVIDRYAKYLFPEA